MAPPSQDEQSDDAPTQTNWFGLINTDIAFLISVYLVLADRQSFFDCCRACRTLITDKVCIAACTQAGLSQIPGVTPRAMWKLLGCPRTGVCNWSDNEGNPKDNTDFSKIWATTAAIAVDLKVALHPTLQPWLYVDLYNTAKIEDVTLRVAPREPLIYLCHYKLYQHEYICSPPLDELRVILRANEETSLERDALFRIRNPTGVTLGNFWGCLFEFLHQSPHMDTPLSDYMYNNYSENYRRGRMLPVARTSETLLADIARFAFENNCPTNLAMLNRAYKHFYGIQFAHRVLCIRQPMISSNLDLLACVDGRRGRYLDRIDEPADDKLWGLARVGFHRADMGMAVPSLGLNGEVEEFWSTAAPLFSIT